MFCEWSAFTLWHAAALRLLEAMVLIVCEHDKAEVHLNNYKGGNEEDYDPPHHLRHLLFAFLLAFVVHLLELLLSHALASLAGDRVDGESISLSNCST